MQLSQLVRVAIVRIAATTLERSLGVGEWSDADLRNVGYAFATTGTTNAMVRALIGERASAIQYVRTGGKEWDEVRRSAPSTGEEDTELIGSMVPGLIPRLAWVTGFIERNLGFYLDAMETNISFASLPFPRNLAACTNLVRQQELEANRHYYLLSSLLLPSVDRILIRESECTAWLIMAQTALALERFRLKYDRLPKDLNALVPLFLPTVPHDPFDGTPLRYKPLDKGYVVYSVGPDGRDDGGKEPPARRRVTEHVPEDITMTVER